MFRSSSFGTRNLGPTEELPVIFRLDCTFSSTHPNSLSQPDQPPKPPNGFSQLPKARRIVTASAAPVVHGHFRAPLGQSSSAVWLLTFRPWCVLGELLPLGLSSLAFRCSQGSPCWGLQGTIIGVTFLALSSLCCMGPTLTLPTPRSLPGCVQAPGSQVPSYSPEAPPRMVAVPSVPHCYHAAFWTPLAYS